MEHSIESLCIWLTDRPTIPKYSHSGHILLKRFTFFNHINFVDKILRIDCLLRSQDGEKKHSLWFSAKIPIFAYFIHHLGYEPLSMASGFIYLLL